MESIEKKEKYKNIILAIIFLFVLLMYALIAFYINKIYEETNNLTFYFIQHILSTTPYILILLASLFRNNKLKFIIKGILITTLLWCIVECFYMPRRYDYIRINGEEPSMAEYKYAILKDVIEGRTSIITIPHTGVLPKEDDIYIGARHRTKTKREYICYLEENGKYNYVTESTKNLNNIINELKKISGMKNLEIKITIEYYNNSGIIKKIEGTSIHDYEEIINKFNLLIEQNIEETENKKNEEEKLKQEEQEIKKKKEEALIKIKQNAIGKNIETIKKELEKNEILDYSIKYISSKLYSSGKICFIDNNKLCFYVVKDNKKEEMIKMPNIKVGMTKEEVMKILNASGLKGYISGTSKAYNNEKSGTLKYYAYSPGTLLPKGLAVGFSIYE